MKLAVFSDLHINNWTAFSDYANGGGFNNRLLLTVKALETIFQDAEETGCEAVLFAGDFFHTRKVDADVLYMATKALEKCKLPILGIAGNHDLSSADRLVYSSKAMGKIIWLENSCLNIGGLKIGGVPYGHDPKKAPTCDVLLMHAGINGFHMGSDYIADDGKFYNFESLFGQAGIVIAGHFHSPQWANKTTKGNLGTEYVPGELLLVPGSPEAHTFSDSGKSHGFWILNTDKKCISFAPLASPGFVDVKTGQEDVRGNYVRCQLPSNVDEKLIDKWKQFLAAKSPGYRIELMAPETGSRIRDKEIASKKSIEDILERFIATTESKADKQDLLKIGMAIYREADQDKS